jgi:serine/threonine-protein kinase
MIKNFFKMVIYLASFLAAGAVAVFLVVKILNIDKTGEVPLLEGKSLTEAAELLNKRKLFLKIKGRENHSEVSADHIIKQNIKPGEEVLVGSEIGVFVSKGPEMYTMPSFEGQDLRDAKLTLVNLGIKISKITWVHSDTVKKGWIIAQRPLPGNIESNEINFLVSLGHYAVSYKCPVFVNMTTEDARMLAGELGIKLNEKETGGRVIDQKPAAGIIIKKGDSVEVVLGRGWGMWF